ncbi:expressed unknown protein (Partial), partial [Seminavis robusta]|eukprot:Sro984_g227870.1 n/a (285) ;mRNA; r:2-856
MTNRHSCTPSLSEANKEAADIINSDRQQRRVASITSTTTTPSTTASSSGKQPETEGRRGKTRSSATRTTESSVERKLAKEVEFWDSNYQSGGNKDFEVAKAELTVSQEPFVRTTRTSQSSHSSNTSSGRPFTRRSSLSTSSTGSRRFKMRKVNSTGSNGKGGGSKGNKESGLEETMTGKAQVLGATNSGGTSTSSPRPSGIKRTATSGSTEGRRNRGGNRSNHSQSTSSALRRAVTDTGMSRSKHEVSPTTRSNNKLTSQFMRKGVPTKGFPTHATAISTTATNT